MGLTYLLDNERGPKDSGAVIDHAPEPPTPTQPMSSAASNLKRKASDLSDLTDFRPATRLRIQDPWYLPVVVVNTLSYQISIRSDNFSPGT